MTLYFKTAFKPYYDLCRSKRKKQPVSDFVLKYAREAQPGILDSLQTQAQKDNYIELLKMLMFCHRHQKNDAYLANTPVDFSVVREPMYKYSRVAQDRFFKLPEFAFLFAFFA